MEKEVGKGLIKSIFGVTIIVIVVVVLIIYGKGVLEKEKIKDFHADLLLVQGKVEVAAGNYNMDKEAHPLKGVKLNELPEEINIEEFKSKNVIPQEEYEKYYLLNSRKFSRTRVR